MCHFYHCKKRSSCNILSAALLWLVFCTFENSIDLFSIIESLSFLFVEFSCNRLCNWKSIWHLWLNFLLFLYWHYWYYWDRFYIYGHIIDILWAYFACSWFALKLPLWLLQSKRFDYWEIVFTFLNSPFFRNMILVHILLSFL